MLAVRVPPSACSTSQSTTTCRSPSTVMSHAARRLRPMSRWISTVRPLCLPLAASRSTRSGDEPGSIEYSAVTQPLPARASSAARPRRWSPCTAPGAAERDEARAGGHLGEVAFERDRAQRVGSAAIGAGHGGSSLRVSPRAAPGSGVVELGPGTARRAAERLDVAARHEAVRAGAGAVGRAAARARRGPDRRRTPLVGRADERDVVTHDVTDPPGQRIG